MTKYLLHGGFTRLENELNRSFYEEFTRDLPEGGTIALVYFASRSDDTTDVFEEQKVKITNEAGGREFSFIHSTQENFIEDITAADAIYFHGGSTNKLLKILRSYPDFKYLLVGKTVAGSSAGAYALVRYGASHSESAVREGLGFVNVRAVCHYESPELPPYPDAVELLRHTAEDLELILLKDCEWKKVEE